VLSKTGCAFDLAIGAVFQNELPYQKDLITLLSDFEVCAGLYVRWEPFGTS
jgi:hypothetical protein